jgi:hypothetical protein
MKREELERGSEKEKVGWMEFPIGGCCAEV